MRLKSIHKDQTHQTIHRIESHDSMIIHKDQTHLTKLNMTTQHNTE